MREKIEEIIESVIAGDMSHETHEELTDKLEKLFKEQSSNMHWKKIKEKDEGGTFTVHLFKTIAESKKGVKLVKHPDGVMVEEKDGTQYLVEYEEIYKNLQNAIDKEEVELALED